LIEKNKVSTWRLKAAKMVYQVKKILSVGGSPFQSGATRNSAITATFICAHAAARRQLKLFADLEIRNLEHTVNLDQSTDLSDIEHQGSDVRDVEPYWDTKTLDAMYQNISDAEKIPNQSRSLLHRLATSELVLPDDIKSILSTVLQESRDEQEKAERFLDQLKTAIPEELLDVSTEFTSVDILHKQSKMLDFFLQLGLLEESEISDAQDIINSRMKKLHGHYHID